MSGIIFKPPFDENKSFDKVVRVADNSFLSQKYLAVTPNCSNWLFYCLHGDNPHTANTSFIDFVFAKCLSFMVWLILQNKPTGEYVERFTRYAESETTPPYYRAFTQNYLGVFS